MIKGGKGTGLGDALAGHFGNLGRHVLGQKSKSTDPAKAIRKSIGTVQEAGENVQFLLEQANKETAAGFRRATQAFSKLDSKVVTRLDDMADLFDRLAYQQRTGLKGGSSALKFAFKTADAKGKAGPTAQDHILNLIKDLGLEALGLGGLGVGGLIVKKIVEKFRKGAEAPKVGEPGVKPGEAPKGDAGNKAGKAGKVIEEAIKGGGKPSAGVISRILKIFKGGGGAGAAAVGEGVATGGLSILGLLGIDYGLDKLDSWLGLDKNKKNIYARKVARGEMTEAEARAAIAGGEQVAKIDSQELVFDVTHDINFDLSKELVFDAEKIFWGKDSTPQGDTASKPVKAPSPQQTGGAPGAAPLPQSVPTPSAGNAGSHAMNRQPPADGGGGGGGGGDSGSDATPASPPPAQAPTGGGGEFKGNQGDKDGGDSGEFKGNQGDKDGGGGGGKASKPKTAPKSDAAPAKPPQYTVHSDKVGFMEKMHPAYGQLPKDIKEGIETGKDFKINKDRLKDLSPENVNKLKEGGYISGSLNRGGYSDEQKTAVLKAYDDANKTGSQDERASSMLQLAGMRDDAVSLIKKMDGTHQKRNRDALMSYLKDGGVGLDPATKAWCAATIGATLHQVGAAGSEAVSKNPYLANSYQKLGVEVDVEHSHPGDIVVNKKQDPKGKGGPDDAGGHVMMQTEEPKDGKIGITGGNQGGERDHSRAITSKQITPGKDYTIRRWFDEFEPHTDGTKEDVPASSPNLKPNDKPEQRASAEGRQKFAESTNSRPVSGGKEKGGDDGGGDSKRQSFSDSTGASPLRAI